MKLKRIHLRKLAGYESLIWEGIQPDLNLLLGRNGAGKSSLLQALSYGLNILGGRRTESILLRTYPDSEVGIESADGRSWRFSFGHIRKDNLWEKAGKVPLKTYYVVENRQPKNTIGDIKNIRTDLQQHHINRYPNAISQVKLWLESDKAEERETARRVLEFSRRIAAPENPPEWEWIESEIRTRTPQKARPVSCGQFDIVAFVLDLVRLQKEISREPEPLFILLDNPETYLHPACQEPILELVSELFPDAQVFIASHSLKLLCHRQSKSVFWLSRDSGDETGLCRVHSVRELSEGAKAVFFDLYGDDVSSAVLGLLSAFESPEYYRFLCQCALAPEAVIRPRPEGDRQLRVVGEQINRVPGVRTILDFGAGNGDLLVALLAWGLSDDKTVYVGLDPSPSRRLQERLEEATRTRAISSQSRLITSLADAPEDCDVITLINVCHEIMPPELPELLSELLTRNLSDSGRIVIHEVETLSAGESSFVMWTPTDYLDIFRRIEGVVVEVAPKPKTGGGVPLDTTIISLRAGGTLPDDLSEKLTVRFWQQLPVRKKECLAEIEQLWADPKPHVSGFQEALRQRRLAFLSAQVTTISLLEPTIGL